MGVSVNVYGYTYMGVSTSAKKRHGIFLSVSPSSLPYRVKLCLAVQYFSSHFWTRAGQSADVMVEQSLGGTSGGGHVMAPAPAWTPPAAAAAVS